MRKLLFPAVLILLACSSWASDVSVIENEIRAVMDRQTGMWNEGNIKGFMEFYWNSEDFTFQSGKKRLHGWDELYSMYKEKYSGENRGVLDFSDIEIKILSNDTAYVLGWWRVTLKDSHKEGLFTLIFRRMDEGWRIVHDHSS